MGRCLAILVATIVVVGLLSAMLPRITSGGFVGGLTRSDFVLMCGLPLGAFCAGRHWYRYELFLWYGALGLLTFVPAYLSDGNVRLSYTRVPFGEQELEAILHDAAGWTIAVVAAAIICMLVGRWANRHVARR